jgi:hypothetical protein
MTCCSFLQIRSLIWIQIRIQLSDPDLHQKVLDQSGCFFLPNYLSVVISVTYPGYLSPIPDQNYSVPDPGSKGTGSRIRNKEI